MDKDALVLDLRHLSDESIKTMLVTAIMCYPNNNEARQKWILKNLLLLAAYHYETNIEDAPGETEKINFSREIGAFIGENIYDFGGWNTFASVLVGSGQKRGIVDETKERAGQGASAGAQMLLAYVEEIPKSKAAESLVTHDAYLKLIKKGTLGRANYQNPGSLNRILKEFTPALHLWVSFMLNQSAARTERSYPFIQGVNTSWPTSFLLPIDQFDGGLTVFIKSSEAFLEELSSKYPPTNRPGPRIPMLAPHKCWKIIL